MSYNEAHYSRRSRKRWTGWASALATACCLSFAFVWSAAAGDTCYKITDLGALGFTPGSDTVFGINNNDEAVFTALVGGKKHAMLYLPAAAYHLTAGCHDLHSLAGLHADAESAAYEINNAGMAVGWADIEVEPDTFEQHALVWKINEYNPLFVPPVPKIDLSTYTAPSNGAPDIEVPTVAWAINDATPPVVVGDASGLTNCVCPPTLKTVATIMGFRAVLDGNDLLEELLPILSAPCDFESYGRDISSVAVGYSDIASAGQCLGNGGACANSKDAVYFLSGGAPVALTDLSAGGSESRGVNDATSIVGWGYANDDSPCARKALFWEGPADLVPTTLPTVQAGDDAWAEAINNLALPQVVGWNEDTDAAILWECDGPDCDNPLNWSVTDLNDTIQDCSANWSLRMAFDLTDAATPSIVGWGFRSGVQHGFLLTPDPACCPADLDGNGTVGASDELALLAAWGPCPNCGNCGVECPADLDCNCNVGASDLAILIAAWGPCPGSDHGSSDALEQAVEEMGYDDVEDYEEWLAQASEPEAFASGWVLYALLTDGE